MLMRILHLSLIALAGLFLSADRAWGLGEILGQSKEELKLQYDVAVQDHGTGRVTVVLTIADEGRLKPLDAVELMIPGRTKEADGGQYMDLAVSLDLKRAEDGKRVARVHITKELAVRAEIWLTSTTFDGKRLVMTRYHHVIPIAKFLTEPPKEKTRPPAANGG